MFRASFVTSPSELVERKLDCQSSARTCRPGMEYHLPQLLSRESFPLGKQRSFRNPGMCCIRHTALVMYRGWYGIMLPKASMSKNLSGFKVSVHQSSSMHEVQRPCQQYFAQSFYYAGIPTWNLRPSTISHKWFYRLEHNKLGQSPFQNEVHFWVSAPVWSQN